MWASRRSGLNKLLSNSNKGGLMEKKAGYRDTVIPELLYIQKNNEGKRMKALSSRQTDF
jgi:hypothetical protein